MARGEDWRGRVALALSGAACLIVAHPAQAREDGAVQLSGAYTAEAWRNVRGGLRKGSAYLDNLELAAQAQVTPAPGWRPARVRVSGFLNNAQTLSNSIVGDLQSISSKDTDGGARLYEAWVKQDLGAASLKLGRIDLNNEFNVNRTGGLFINGAQGIGLDVSQMANDGASLFPDTSLGAVATAGLSKGWTLRLGGFDGAPHDRGPPPNTAPEFEEGHGAFLIAEAAYETPGGTRLTLGAWRHTAKFARLMQPSRPGRAGGAYGLVEWTVARGGERRLEASARIGLADPRTQQIAAHLSAGVVLTRPFLGADEEAIGLALAVAVNGDDFRRAERRAGVPVRRGETNLELTYRFAPTPWLHLQPDVQYVIHPGAVRDRKNALVVGLRATISWSSD